MDEITKEEKCFLQIKEGIINSLKSFEIIQKPYVFLVLFNVICFLLKFIYSSKHQEIFSESFQDIHK